MRMFAQDGAFYRGAWVDLRDDPEALRHLSPLQQPLTTAAVRR